jgi:hypothetical protein
VGQLSRRLAPARTVIMRRALLLSLALHACADEAPAPPDTAPGPDCAALLTAGERARACDPAIDPLLVELRARPEEQRCRVAARQLLAPAPPRARVVSVYEAPPALGAAPLSQAELGALAELPLPGSLVLEPDLAPRPGVPTTTATLAGAPLRVDAAGRLRGTHAPGRHSLEVRHAGAEARACVTLAACETVALTAHGAALAPHPALSAGPCP